MVIRLNTAFCIGHIKSLSFETQPKIEGTFSIELYRDVVTQVQGKLNDLLALILLAALY